jgi:hypothetical protein
MAQTRATSKALRQPLGFVMTLAGYAATPAEEMPREEVVEEAIVSPAGDIFPDQREDGPSQFQPPPSAPPPSVATRVGTITEAQTKMIFRLVKVLAGQGVTEDSIRAGLQLQYGTSHFSELAKGEASTVITDLKRQAGED